MVHIEKKSKKTGNFSQICLSEWIVDGCSKEINKESNGMLHVWLNEHDHKRLDTMTLLKLLHAQRESVCKVINHAILCVNDEQMVEKCEEIIENNEDLKIFVYFISESKKYKQSLKDAIALILNDVNWSRVNKIWIYEEPNQFSANVIGCVAASIILHCIVNHCKVKTGGGGFFLGG